MQDGGLTIQIHAEPVAEAKCHECGQMLDLLGVKPLTRIACPTCGGERSVPGRFANYLVLELLGSGGMGAVYRGLDTLLDRPIALKVLLKSLQDKPDLREKFRREAKAAANINHINVTHVYAFGEENGQPYIVMEYVTGKSLDFIMGHEKNIDQTFVINTGLQIAEGLQAGSKIGLIHGDVKPENILFDSEYTAKLIDFGLASFVDEDVKGGVWGSPYYLSPERVQRLPTDSRSDIYSLGATLYHALAAHPPFDGETALEVLRARLDHPPQPLTLYRPEAHPSVIRVINRMLAMDMNQRHPDYATLITDLRNTLNSLSSVQYPTERIIRRAPALTADRNQDRSARITTQRRRRANQPEPGKTPNSWQSPGSVESNAVGRVLGILAFLGVSVLVAVFLLNTPSGRPPPPSSTHPGYYNHPPLPAPTPPPAPAAERPAPGVALSSVFVRFDAARLTDCRGYGGNGTAAISDSGASLNLKGPVWKAYPISYVIRTNTVMEFDFASRKQGAVQGIGLARDNGARTERLFGLYGSRKTGIRGYDYAIHAPQSKRFIIPVGQHYQGSVTFLVFANDDNSDSRDSESTYSHIRLYDK